MAIIFTFVYAFSWTPIIRIMSDNQEILNLAKNYAIWIISMPLLAFASFLWDGIYIGATASVQLRNSMLIATVVVFFPIYYSLHNLFENHALWIALLSFLFTRGVAQYFMAKKAVYSKVETQ